MGSEVLLTWYWAPADCAPSVANASIAAACTACPRHLCHPGGSADLVLWQMPMLWLAADIAATHEVHQRFAATRGLKAAAASLVGANTAAAPILRATSAAALAVGGNAAALPL